MIPGPTPVPEKVLQALSKHPIGHRSKEFQDLVESTTKNLQWLHQTQNDVLTITGSGTAAMEAGIINTLSKGDKVICGENGKFGERWVKVAKEFGLEVIKINSEWGTPLDPEEFKKVLEEDNQKEIKIEIHSVGLLKDDSYALGISFAKSGLDLDITQNLEIWTLASLEEIPFNNPVQRIPKSRRKYYEKFKVASSNSK